MTKINIEEAYKEPRVNLQQGDLIMLKGIWYIIVRDSFNATFRFVGLTSGAIQRGLSGAGPVELLFEYFSLNDEFELVQGLNYFSRDTLEITLKEVGGNI